ncbi:MAG: hypothetical protein QXT77_07410 [Candidatus Methanomethylicaceae archaeon]
MKCNNKHWVCPADTPILVPCGKCLPCLSNKRTEWIIRLEEEQKVSSSSYFVTLTYSERYLPRTTGLSKRHLQLFFKRLRKTEKNLRYYAVGEYGTQKQRAHYHIILFNLKDVENLRKCWTHPKTKEDIGIVHVGNVTQASIAYTTKYIIQKGNAQTGNLNPPFQIMSRGYGLGAHYLSDNVIRYHRDSQITYYMDYAVKKRLPRFYKEKIWPRVKGIYLGATDWNYIRDRVSKKQKKIAEQQEMKNFDILLAEGYNPDTIQAEMRSAAEGRISVKTSYSQTL